MWEVQMPPHNSHLFSLPQCQESHSYVLALPLPVCLASVQISAKGLWKRQGMSRLFHPVCLPVLGHSPDPGPELTPPTPLYVEWDLEHA